jgi:hypothetical protein
MVAWIYGMASGVRASNKAPYFVPLLGHIMVGLAKALKVLAIPEQLRLSLMRKLMINNRSRHNSSSLLAHLAQWLVP